MLREQYRKLYDQIHQQEDLIETAVRQAVRMERRTNQRTNQRRNQKKAHALGRKKRKSITILRRSAIVLASAALCLFLAIPALAANVESVYWMMYSVSPSVSQYFMPIKKSDEDNGIKMEVVSACIHGSTAEIYITMQDLTGDRIDGTIDLYDSYRINRPFDSSCHCELAGYDEDTDTATFLITIDEWGGQDISGDKITFSVRKFLSRKKNYDDIKIPLDLSDIKEAGHTQTVSIIGGSAQDGAVIEEMMFEQDPEALVPSEPMHAFPVDGIELTGIGYMDGKLHVQTAVRNPLDHDNHGFFYLRNRHNGREAASIYTFSFTNLLEQADRIDYEETVFDIPREELADYELYGDFVTSGMKTEGNWRVTFPLEDAEH